MSGKPDLAAALVAELTSLPDEALAPLAERLATLLEPSLAARHRAPQSLFVSAEEAAELLRCRKRRIYELVGDGRLERCGDGRRLLLRRQQVERLAGGSS